MEEHPHYLLYNSGVMLFEKDSPFIDLWIDGCQKFSKKYNGDQDILGLILMDHPKKVGILDKIYNFISHHDELPDKKKVKIFHYVAYLKEDLLKNASATSENLRENNLVPDPADRATIEEEHALELRTRDRERKLLKKVEQALGRIESGDYGWCEETGEAIGLSRLLARPTANLSLEAQERRELRQKLFGD
jgi:RNA polymerase-binding protein DksA